MPRDDPAHASVYTQLMALSRQTFMEGHYATAYHALAAAMHFADDTHNARWLGDVETLAQEQYDWLVTHAPHDPLAPRASARRGTHNLWDTLARQAATRRHMLSYAQQPQPVS